MMARTSARMGGRAVGPAPVQPEPVYCMRCECPVTVQPWGCKNPCGNCGFVYPLGDCSD